MNGKKPTPPGEQFVKLPRDLLRSDAWRSLGINEHRLIHFLMLEHLSKGGKHNGQLKAPYAQLEAFGIGARFVGPSILQVEALGLVACSRGGMRVATTYALTWLPLHDGTPATNDWLTYRNPTLPPLPKPKSRNLPDKGKVGLPSQGKVDDPNLPDKGKVDRPETLPSQGKVLYRESYQDGAEYSSLSAEPAAPLRSGAKGAP
jgi:hypothetical protein